MFIISISFSFFLCFCFSISVKVVKELLRVMQMENEVPSLRLAAAELIGKGYVLWKNCMFLLIILFISVYFCLFICWKN